MRIVDVPVWKMVNVEEPGGEEEGVGVGIRVLVRRVRG